MNPSPTGTVNSQDIQKWLHNMLVFISPLALIYLAAVADALDKSGFNWGIFALTPMTQGAIALYVLNSLTDLFTKIKAGPTV